MARRGADDTQFGVQVATRLALPRLTQCATNPLGHGRPVPACDLLELFPLVWVEENLQALTHRMSINDVQRLISVDVALTGRIRLQTVVVVERFPGELQTLRADNVHCVAY